MSTAQTNKANAMKRTYKPRSTYKQELRNVFHCCVKSCPHYKKKSSLMLYPMPSNSKIKESWCNAFNISKDEADDPLARVCSLHFRSRSESLPPILGKSKVNPSVPSPLYNPSVPLPLPKSTVPTSIPKQVPPNQIITVIINNNNYKVMGTSTALPSLQPPIPPDISQELSTRPNNIEKVKFLKEAISKIENVGTEYLEELNPENTNSENDVASPQSEEMVLEPDISEIVTVNPDASVEPVCEQVSDEINLEPEVILDSSDDSISDEKDDTFLELDCEDEPLSETQLDCFMKEMVEFLSANQTVYRLAQTPNTPKFPTVRGSETDASSRMGSNVLTCIDGGSTLSTNSPLAPTPKLFQNSIMVSPFSNAEKSKSNPPSFLSYVPANSTVTDVTKKYSVVQDASGKVLAQNMSSNLSVNGNVIFTKDLNINQNSNFPIGSNTVGPLGTNPVLNNASLPFVPNINMANFDWKANSNQVPQLSVLKSNQTGVPNANPQKFHILTPISSVPQLKPMNSQPLNVISSQGNLPFILSPFVSSSKSLPSNVVFTFAPISNSSELKTVFSSAPMPSVSNSITNPNGPLNNVSSQPGLPQSTVYQLVNLPGAPKPLTLTNNLEQVGPVSFKPAVRTYQKGNQENPLSSSLKSDTLDESAGPSIQIVDVKGAKEGGAGEFFGESSMLSNKKNPSDKSRKIKTLSDSDCVISENVQNDDSQSDNEPEEKDIFFQFVGRTAVSELDSIFLVQGRIPVINCGFFTNTAKNLLTIQRGEAKNRLSDANELREKLKNAEFVTAAIPWMLKKKYLPTVPPCGKCGDSILMLERTNSLRFKEGYCYTCYNTNCRQKTPIKRGTFFDRFQSFSTQCLLLLTYHWACISPLQEMELDLDLQIDEIWGYFKALQHLCWLDAQKNIKLGSAQGNYVEAAVVKVGRNFVLGAYDRKTKQIRMDVLSTEEACNSTTTVKLLTEWLNPNSSLVTQRAIPEGILQGINTIRCDPTVKDCSSSLPHVLNINHYLKKFVKSLFGQYSPMGSHSKETLTKFLAERQWRERYIRFGVEGAFWSIMDLIREQNPSTGSACATIGIPTQKKVPPTPPVESVCQERWGALFTKRCARIIDICSYGCPIWKESDQSSVQTYEKTRGAFISKSKSSVHQFKKEEAVSTPSSLDSNDYAFENCELIKLAKTAPLLSLFRTIPEIKGLNNKLTFDGLLSIKIEHLRKPKDVIDYRRNAIELGTALRKEGFHTHPVKWLVKKNFIKHESNCYVCGSAAYLRDNSKFPDGCSWSCQNKECNFENIFKRPKFFARFPHQSMNHLLALIFHWIAQTKIDNILTDTSIKRQKIAHTWKAFQIKCNQTLLRENIKLGGPSSIVELAVVEHGHKYILGVLDRKSNLTALKAFKKEDFTEQELFRFIRFWVKPGTAIVVNAHPSFPLPRQYLLNVADFDTSSELNVNRITRYLSSHLKNIFGRFNPMAVSSLLAQLYLDELMWRERFDGRPITSFSKLMQELFIDDFMVIEDLEETIDKEVHEEMPTCAVKLKEVQIVLKRIPQTVLKYYNCLDIDSSQSSSEEKAPPQSEATTSKLETIIEIEDDVEKDEDLESIIDIENDEESSTSSRDTDFPNLDTTSQSDPPLTHAVFSEEVIATPSDPVFNRKKEVYGDDNSDEDYVADDSESDEDEEEEELENSSADEFDPVSVFRNFKWKKKRRIGAHKKIEPITYYKNSKSDNLSDSLDTFMFSDSSRNSNSTQSVQPLVINVCRKNKEPMFFIKSDSSATASAAENSIDCYDGYVSESHPGSEVSLPEAFTSLESGPSVDTANCLNIKPCINIKSSINIEPVVETKISSETKSQTSEKEKKSSSKLKRPIEDYVECIECGDSLGSTMEHFMKKFECADCKNHVYTTCCSNAFFEHRGSLLFGKRMPKKLKRNFGIHKNVVLEQLWYCKCGFNSSLGNKLASHLLKCPKTSGYVTTKK